MQLSRENLGLEFKRANFYEKCILSLLLSLPFLFLIERTPADFGVSMIVILFLANSINGRIFTWDFPIWIKLCLVYSFSLAILGIFSEKPSHAIIESLIWLRFPLFCAAAVSLFTRFPNFLRMQLLLTAFGSIIMCLILFAELTYNFETWSNVGAFGGRLTWPYGDAVSGNYLAKFCLCILVLASTNYGVELRKKSSGSSFFPSFSHLHGVYLLFVFIFIVLTGERMNTIVLTSACGIAFFLTCLDRPKILLCVGTVLILVFATLVIIQPVIFFKFIYNFGFQVLNFSSTGYWHLWATGIDGFLSNKTLGLGTGNFRHLCEDIVVVVTPLQRCDNHPHNFLIQSFSEGGILGGLLYMSVITSIFLHVYKFKRESDYHKTIWIIPVILFFPFRTNSDLFGQWNNLMLWYSIAQALAISRLPGTLVSDLFRRGTDAYNKQV